MKIQNPLPFINSEMKSSDPYNPATWLPRGMFLNVDTKNIFGNDFGLIRNYQKKVSDGGEGAINLITLALTGSLTASRDITSSGFYLQPPSGYNMYLQQFNSTAEVLNANDFHKPFDHFSTKYLQLYTRGQLRYQALSFADMALGATSKINTMENLFNPHLYTGNFSTNINPAGLYKSANNDRMHFKFDNDLPIEHSLAYTRLHFAFFVWLTEVEEEE